MEALAAPAAALGSYTSRGMPCAQPVETLASARAHTFRRPRLPGKQQLHRHICGTAHSPTGLTRAMAARHAGTDMLPPMPTTTSGAAPTSAHALLSTQNGNLSIDRCVRH